jgi:restriction endonuclease Mrr
MRERHRRASSLGSCATARGSSVSPSGWSPAFQNEIAKHNAEAEAELLKQLRALDPSDFEQLVGELLRALGIRDVEVTQYHGDKGIDATGVHELAPGLLVRIAVQAKRQEANANGRSCRR